MHKMLALLALLMALPAGAAPNVVGDDVDYEVKPGESLYEAARHHGLAMEHVAWANDLPVQFDLGGTEQLVLPQRRILPKDPPEDGLVLNLPERGLFLFRKGEFQAFYPVAIGEPGKYETPAGEYEILSRVVDPAWVVPEFAEAKYEREVVPAGPDNPLGDRWLGLTWDGLGIHSTTAPQSIGGAVSHGCVRLYPPQARDLFDRVEEGMAVRLEYEPVKAGTGPDGRLYLAVFPDVYDEVDLREEVERVLARDGALGLVPRARLAGLQEDGVARPILGDDVRVTAGGRALDLPVLPVLKEGSLWIPVAALDQAGVGVEWRPETKLLTFESGSESLRVARPPLWDGHALVPARAVLEALGLPFAWDASTRTLSL